MSNKKVFLWIVLSFGLFAMSLFAQADEVGQVIQITTRLHSFLGKPSWLLVIRDLDHNQNLPYLFDITQGDSFFLAYTHSRNYLILASNLQMETYKPYSNQFKNYRIHNFCHLESQGRIIHGESISLTIEGDLTPDSSSYSCIISQYPDTAFTIVTPDDDT